MSKAKDPVANQDGRLTAISVAGFKSIVKEQTLHIAPLTILAGANSSGKSSMMQPLLLMKQTLEAPYDPGVFLLDGPNVRFTSSKQILSINSTAFSISIKSNDFTVTASYKGNKTGNFTIKNFTYDDNNGKKVILRETMDTEGAYPLIKEAKGLDFGENFIYNISRHKCTLNISIATHDRRTIAYGAIIPLEIFSETTKKIIHVPGLRGNPSRSYRSASIDKYYHGTFENYSSGIITGWQANDHSKTRTLCDNLALLGLTWKVEAKQIDATKVEIKVGRLAKPKRGGARDLVNIADVGVGVSQTLPVLVALLAAEPGQIVYIEQPEIHLHPLAQYKLAAVIAEASKRGVLVIIETHSDILIRGVQTLVAKGELDPAIVKLHWFSRSPEDGSTTVTCAELDENGAFGDWPQDFDTTALDTEKAYLDAVEARIATHEK